MTRTTQPTAKVAAVDKAHDMTQQASHQSPLSEHNVKVIFDMSRLRNRDADKPYRVNMANQVVQHMSQRLSEQYFQCPNDGEIALEIHLMVCSEGSRCGRICCAELGSGWVKLMCEWELLSLQEKGGKTSLLTNPQKELLRDSGAIGIADLFSPTFGEDTILNKLSYQMADVIGNKAVWALRNLKPET